MPFKCTFLFKGPLNTWKEDWYIANGSNSLDVLNSFKTLVPTRQALCGDYTYITGCNVNNITPGIINSTAYVAFPQNLPGNPLAGIITDTAYNAVICRTTATLNGQFYHRTMWLRGVPDGWIQFDANSNPVFDPAMQPLINAFVTAATGLGVAKLCLQSIDKTPGANRLWQLSSVFVNNLVPNGITLGTVLPHNLVAGQVVSVKGNRGSNLRQDPPGRLGVNGKWIVVDVGTNLVDIALPASYLPGVPVARKLGTVRGNALAYPAITRIEAVAFGSRATRGLTVQQRAAKRRRLPSIPGLEF